MNKALYCIVSFLAVFSFTYAQEPEYLEPTQQVTYGNRQHVSLESGMIYYWRVQAGDNNNNISEFSPVRTFNTEPNPDYNSIPFLPEQIKPGNFSSVDNPVVLLEWSAVDPDGDELMYDLYLSTEDPPELFKADLQENYLEVNAESGNLYFWRIVAKDRLGAKAVGEVWKFTVK